MAKIFGSVQVVEQPEATTLPNDAQLAWDKAMEGMVGADYKIISYVGSQIVTGINRVYLVQQKLVLEKPVYHIATIVINEFNGEYQITSIERLF